MAYSAILSLRMAMRDVVCENIGNANADINIMNSSLFMNDQLLMDNGKGTNSLGSLPYLIISLTIDELIQDNSGSV